MSGAEVIYFAVVICKFVLGKDLQDTKATGMVPVAFVSNQAYFRVTSLVAGSGNFLRSFVVWGSIRDCSHVLSGRPVVGCGQEQMPLI